MKKTGTIFLAALATILIFSWITAPIMAAEEGYQTTNGYVVQTGEQASYNYTNQNRLTIRNQFAYNITGDISIQSAKISNKDFIIEITEATGDMEMNMTCTEEQEQLGLLMGNRYMIRNRNRFRYQEGFAVNINCNCTEIQARLRIEANNQNRNGEWAYYNGENGQWETVLTTVEDGYLTATTDHFSVWTILIPETNFTLWIILGGSVAAVAALGIVVYLYKRKR